jgi:hypothetical protein
MEKEFVKEELIKKFFKKYPQLKNIKEWKNENRKKLKSYK